jgi:Cys-tRNA(Pro)/Cys-tRNA(Cys) deacylase
VALIVFFVARGRGDKMSTRQSFARRDAAMSAKGTPAVQAVVKAGIAHRLLTYDYDPAADAIGLQAAEALGLNPTMVFKTLIVELDTGALVCALIPAAARLDLKVLAAVAGAKKTELAEPAKAERSSGYVVGGISPLGQRKRLRGFIDASATALKEIVVNGGRRGLQIALRPSDLVHVTDATLHPITVEAPR